MTKHEKFMYLTKESMELPTEEFLRRGNRIIQLQKEALEEDRIELDAIKRRLNRITAHGELRKDRMQQYEERLNKIASLGELS